MITIEDRIILDNFIRQFNLPNHVDRIYFINKFNTAELAYIIGMLINPTETTSFELLRRSEVDVNKSQLLIANLLARLDQR